MKKYINQGDMKQINVSDTFSLIRKNRSLTRKQIGELTGFSWGGVSKFVSLLLNMGLIIEKRIEEPGKKGRAAHSLEINGEDNFILGVDVNISGIRATVINLMNEVLDSCEAPADYSGKEALLEGLYCIIEKMLGRFSDRRILGIGIAMQGAVDSKNGVSVRLNQCPGWHQIELAALVRDRFGLNTYLEHDPNCILLAHTEIHNLTDAILFRIDKGVGMAVKKANHLIHGESMLEIGHTTVEYENGVTCFCGNRGCLESYVSQNGIMTLAQEPFEETVRKARAGCEREKQLFRNMARYLGISIANMMRIFYIDKLIFCGSMMKCRDLFFDDMMNVIADCSITDGVRSKPSVTVLDWADAAYGAAIMASERIIESIAIE